MKVLVTGGAGFIGSHLCQRLVSKGNEVCCVDNFNDYYDPAIKRQNLKDLTGQSGFKLFEEDILDIEKIDGIFSKQRFSHIVHLAARAGVRPSLDNAVLYDKVNIQGTINLLDMCRKYDVEKFVFASSSSVYGGSRKVPFSESDKIDRPISPYAATKRAAELMAYTYHHLFGISVYALRFFTVYGPRQRPEMAIHKFVRSIYQGGPIDVYGDGSSSRDYTYIDDIIDAIMTSIDRVNGYEIINLGDSSPVKLSDLIELIEKATGRKPSKNQKGFQPGDVFTTYADIKKAKKLLDYKPVTDIKKGISNFVAWYKDRNSI